YVHLVPYTALFRSMVQREMTVLQVRMVSASLAPRSRTRKAPAVLPLLLQAGWHLLPHPSPDDTFGPKLFGLTRTPPRKPATQSVRLVTLALRETRVIRVTLDRTACPGQMVLVL